LKQAAVFLCLFVGVLLEQHLWDETIMESPNELTVTDFELAEEGFSVVLTNAIEDARAVVEYLTNEHETRKKMYVDAKSKGREKSAAYVGLGVMQSSEMQFRAQRVLSLLEAAREREAGQLV
jgi:hypothetical protein